MATHHIPGLSACRVSGGAVSWSNSYGWAVVEDSVPTADTTVFSIASVSKLFTGTALMQLYEAGRFDLDENVSGHLPFPVRHPAFPDSAVTFRMLLTHTSALRDNWPLIDSLRTIGDPTVSLREFCTEYFTPGGRFYDSTRNFHDWAPGRGFGYSNSAFALAGFLVETLADSFPEYCRDSIFLPLGMTETSFLFAALDTANVAMPYTWSAGSWVPWGRHSSPLFPAGHLKSSAGQLAGFLVAYLQWGRYDTTAILDSATVALMTSNPRPSGLGLAWRRSLIGSREVWGHSGGGMGMSTYIGFSRPENIGVVVLCNMDGSIAGPAVEEIVAAVLDYTPPGTREAPGGSRIPTPERGATIVRGVLFLGVDSRQHTAYRAELLDISGRKVLALRPGPNDVRHLAPGVYFVRGAAEVRTVGVLR